MNSKTKLIEAVVNISEGRDLKKIEEIVQPLKNSIGVALLHIDSGESANRSVITYVAESEKIVEATFALIKKASELIDMQTQSGVHPRLGAVDVVPFVPLKNITIDECVLKTRQLANKVANELKIPVFLYAKSATSKERESLPFIRSGEYEGLAQKINSGFLPDFGEAVFNKKSGATVIGARNFMLAFNINLKSKNLEVAKKIAATIRTKKTFFEGKEVGGEFDGLQAKGWIIEQFDCAQITTNIHNIEKTLPHLLFERVKTLAREFGEEVNGCELIGLSPLLPLLQAGDFYSQAQVDLNNLSRSDEEKLVKSAIDNLGLNTLGSFNPKERIIEWAIERKLGS